jgi:GNAT superfamily N-acetyltransferase
VDELHSFFLPAHQFAGDTLWSFGTSLKSAYVNSFEFMNHAPVVQLWRDEAGTVKAVSRLSLGTGEWFHLSAPDFRNDATTNALIQQADAAFVLLTDHAHWHTVRYESQTAEIERLERSGYIRDCVTEVYMMRSLEEPIDLVPSPAGIRITCLDQTDAELVSDRAAAQVDAFSQSEPTQSERAWITRSLPHQLRYGGPGQHPNIIAVDTDGSILAFADVFYDRANRIGEFEPVGTRKSARLRGLGKSALTRGLQEMRDAGMRQAIVRTGFDNAAAIATYESVGFVTTDLLVRFRKER